MQHSLWADTSEDEAKIYFQFLDILKTIDKPSLIHYGSFETDFLKQMECAVRTFRFRASSKTTETTLQQTSCQ